jgi:hypothetical protein
MLLPHAQLERFRVECLRRSAPDPLGDGRLQQSERLLALLILADQVADIARIAIALALDLALDPCLIASGSKTFMVGAALKDWIGSSHSLEP